MFKQHLPHIVRFSFVAKRVGINCIRLHILYNLLCLCKWSLQTNQLGLYRILNQKIRNFKNHLRINFRLDNILTLDAQSGIDSFSLVSADIFVIIFALERSELLFKFGNFCFHFFAFLKLNLWIIKIKQKNFSLDLKFAFKALK